MRALFIGLALACPIFVQAAVYPEWLGFIQAGAYADNNDNAYLGVHRLGLNLYAHNEYSVASVRFLTTDISAEPTDNEAYDPHTASAYASVQEQSAESYTDAYGHALLREAMLKAPISRASAEQWHITLGLQTVPVGYNEPYETAKLVDAAPLEAFSFKEAPGLTLNWQHAKETWFGDVGVFSPALRSDIVSLASTPNTTYEAPLYALRGGYRNGNLLHIEGSVGMQDYAKGDISPTVLATGHLSMFLRRDWQVRWAYREIQELHGVLSNSETLNLFETTYFSGQRWAWLVRYYSLYDNDGDDLQATDLGVNYRIDYYTRILAAWREANRSKGYTGISDVGYDVDISPNRGITYQQFSIQLQANF